MISSFSVKNFRGFKDIEINSLNRLNLITGQNNVGKTALLEAFYLLCSGDNAFILDGLNVYRGLMRKSASFEERFRYLFYQGKMENTIELACKEKTDNKHVVEIKLEFLPVTALERGPTSVKNHLMNIQQIEESVHSNRKLHAALKLVYTNSAGECADSFIKINRNALEVVNSSAPVPFDAVYLPSALFAYFSSDNPARFSRLEDEGHEKDIVDSLQKIEPRLKEIKVSAQSDQSNLLVADLGFKPMIPVNGVVE